MYQKKCLNTKILKIIYIKKEVFILRNKKAISPLIATVLLIGFTIVLAALVFQWAGQLFKTTTATTGCESLGRIACTSNMELTLGNVSFSGIGTGASLTNLIVNNGVSSNKITKINVQLEMNDGSINTQALDVDIDPGSSKNVASSPIIFTGITSVSSSLVKAVHVIPGFVQTSNDGSTCNMVCQEQTVTALPTAINFIT